jgi:uncharacterized repeat protein (TIGR02543 family)
MKDVARSCLAALVAVFLGACSNPLMEDLVESMRTPPAAVYTVRFIRNYAQDDTTVLHTKTVVSPASSINAAEFPASPERTGYVFSGWNTKPDGSGTAFIASTTVSADTTVYARWTEVQASSYAVVFKLNDGTGTNHAVRTVTPPASSIDAAEFPDDPERTGYAFSGWTTQADDSGTAFIASTTVSADITVYAQWTANTYSVRFMRNYTQDDTTVLHTTTLTFPASSIDAAEFPDDPERTGYVFSGWTTQADGSGSPFTGASAVTDSISVYAQWTEAGSYAVVFKRNYGTDTNHAVRTVKPPANAIDAAEFPDAPERTGYTFTGWNTQADGLGSNFTDASTVTDSISVYARWTAIAYTVVYEANGGAGTMPATTHTYGVPQDLPANAFARTGYTFAEWNTAVDGNGTAYDDGESVSNLTSTQDEAVPLYAQWTAIVYTISYNNLDGGTNSSENPGSYTIESLDITLAPATRPGYAFGGWHDNAGLSGEPQTRISKGSTEAKTFWAKWTANVYTISYNLDGGSHAGTPATTYTIESSDITLAGATRSGYTFGGWYNNSGFGGTAVPSIPAGSTENKTFYAQWTLVSYTITYNLNSGINGANPTSYTVESPEITLAAPTRTGYDFGGWYVDGGFTGSAVAVIPVRSTENKVFYAKWIPGVSVDPITLQPVPEDPPLIDTEIDEDAPAPFSTGRTEYESWKWYWNGELISGANTGTYTLEANSQSPGIYELSVVVTTTGGGAKLSARCRVTINAK